MTEDSKHLPPSFSSARRWKIGLDTILRALLVLAVVLMANYLGFIFSHQFYLSSQTRIRLAPRTVSILQTLTNHVDVTVYCNKDEFGMYSTVLALLDEYHRIDPRINVKVVDYLRDPAAAVQISEKYGLSVQSGDSGAQAKKDFIIFECEGRVKIAPGNALVQYGAVGMTKDKQVDIRPIAFNGQKMFTAMLLAVTNPKPYTAYFLQSDGEPSLVDPGNSGYLKFGETLQENYINVLPLSISGDGQIPSDCDLLIIAGPVNQFTDSELNKINHYLSLGGRLLVLMDYDFVNHPTGLEDFLAQWGVNVGNYIVQDPNAAAGTGSSFALVVEDFSMHPVVNSLAQSRLEMIYARPVGTVKMSNAPADAPTVTVLAQSSPYCILYGQHGVPPRPYPLMVAAEQPSIKGITSANGGMRMIVVGDSVFLNNQFIEAGENRDFAGFAVNWLLDRPILLDGIGPSKVTEFRLLMSGTQVRNVRWLLLAALPGAVMVFGGLVWLGRRK
jgi:hypothetical protein